MLRCLHEQERDMDTDDRLQDSNISKTKPLVKQLRAVSLTVADLARSIDFYTAALGFELISETTLAGKDYSDLEGIDDAQIQVATLQLGHERIQLMQYLNCLSELIPSDSQSTDLWFQHFAIVVSDIDRAYDHVRSFPIEATSKELQTLPLDNPEAAGVRAFKFKDLDRHNLELIWFPPDKRQAKWNPSDDQLFLGIDHSAIAVANTEQSLRFYRDLLGMQVESSSLHQGEIQAVLDGLPEATVRVTGLRSVEGGMGIELLDYLAPANGRPFPQDWKSCDIAHWQVELVVRDIEKTVAMLQSQNVRLISNRLVSFDRNSLYAQGCLVKDPNGHAMLLITE